MELALSRIISDVRQRSEDVICEDGYLLIQHGQHPDSLGTCIVYKSQVLPCLLDQQQGLHFIALGKDIDLPAWGIPTELVTRVPRPFYEKCDQPPVKPLPGLVSKIWYIPDDMENDPDNCISLSVVKGFNCLLQHRFFVVAPEAVITALRPIANDNICFITHTPNASSHFSGCDLLVTSGAMAAKALLSDIPVIVAGKCGFGGLVTANNLPAFVASAFNGRPGGYTGERISPALLLQEISYVADIAGTAELTQLLHFNAGQLGSLNIYSWEHTYMLIQQVLQQQRLLGERMSDHNGMLQLKPKLSASIILDEMGAPSNQIYWLRNINTNKVLGVVGISEARLIKQCNGENTLNELPGITGSAYDTGDCIEFIRSLWESGIVIFIH